MQHLCYLWQVENTSFSVCVVLTEGTKHHVLESNMDLPEKFQYHRLDLQPAESMCEYNGAQATKGRLDGVGGRSSN